MSAFWPYSLQMVFDNDGSQASGARAYFFRPDTLNGIEVWQDDGRTLSWGSSVQADGNGRMPAVYIDNSVDDSYRFRVDNQAGVTIMGLATIPMNVSGGGGGGGGSTPATLVQTGMTHWAPVDSDLTGYVRLNGKSIGSAASLAVGRRNDDTHALFLFLWNGTGNAECAVLPGVRGASAAIDWGANKTINLPDLRGRAPWGLDTMGNTAAGRLTTQWWGKPTAPAYGGGAQSVLLDATMIPVHTHGLGTLALVAAGAHNHEPIDPAMSFEVAVTGFQKAFTAKLDVGFTALGDTTGTPAYRADATTDTAPAHTHTFTGALATAGGGGGHSNMPPAVMGSWYIKL